MLILFENKVQSKLVVTGRKTVAGEWRKLCNKNAFICTVR
jgi:hypothetical protein